MRWCYSHHHITDEKLFQGHRQGTRQTPDLNHDGQILESLLFTTTYAFSHMEGSFIAITGRHGVVTWLQGSVHGKYLLPPTPTQCIMTKPTAAPYTCKPYLTSFDPYNDPLERAGHGYNLPCHNQA